MEVKYFLVSLTQCTRRTITNYAALGSVHPCFCETPLPPETHDAGGLRHVAQWKLPNVRSMLIAGRIIGYCLFLRPDPGRHVSQADQA
jgi:hypothetical protein